MQRAAAIVLLVLFAISLFPSPFQLGEPANLPACCRKDGKHHCARMQQASHTKSASEPGIARDFAKCARYPLSSPAAARLAAAAVLPAVAYRSALTAHPAAVEQAQAHFRISFRRSAQRRGPPARFS